MYACLIEVLTSSMYNSVLVVKCAYLVVGLQVCYKESAVDFLHITSFYV